MSTTIAVNPSNGQDDNEERQTERETQTTTDFAISATDDDSEIVRLEKEKQMQKVKIQVETYFGKGEKRLEDVVKHSVAMQKQVAPNTIFNIDNLVTTFPINEMGEVNIKDLFVLKELLGQGAFAKVYLAVHKLTGMKVAIKVFEKTKTNASFHRKRVDAEVVNHGKVVNPHFIRLLEVMESDRRIYMILEYAPGGDLLHYVRKRRNLAENNARWIFCDIIKGMYYLHNILSLAHRDIKLDNIMIGTGSQVKIVDLGFSCDATAPQNVACGSPSYTAPEVCSRQTYNGKQSDIWSLGILLFSMLFGYFPFQGQTNEELIAKIQVGIFTIPDFASDQVKSLLQRMLVVDPSTRATVEEVAAHPWLQRAPNYAKVSALHEEYTKELLVDDNLLLAMQGVGFNMEFVTSAVKMNAHNHVTSTYWLLKMKQDVISCGDLSSLSVSFMDSVGKE